LSKFAVNETLSINWEDPHPRVQWDGGSTIGESSCVSCGHCITVCPCNASWKIHAGQAGFFTGISKESLDGMIDVVKDIEPETGYGAILELSEMNQPCASRASPHQNRVHYCELVALRCVDQGSPYPEVEPAEVPRTEFRLASKGNSDGTT